ncbi:hypothetical protein D3C75_742030 [compost metagenome]
MLLLGLAHDRFRQRMAGQLLNRGADCQQFIPVISFSGNKVCYLRKSLSQRPRLVKSNHRGFRHILQMDTAFEENAFTRTFRDGRQHRRHN